MTDGQDWGASLTRTMEARRQAERDAARCPKCGSKAVRPAFIPGIKKGAYCGSCNHEGTWAEFQPEPETA